MSSKSRITRSSFGPSVETIKTPSIPDLSRRQLLCLGYLSEFSVGPVGTLPRLLAVLSEEDYPCGKSNADFTILTLKNLGLIDMERQNLCWTPTLNGRLALAKYSTCPTLQQLRRKLEDMFEIMHPPSPFPAASPAVGTGKGIGKAPAASNKNIS